MIDRSLGYSFVLEQHQVNNPAIQSRRCTSIRAMGRGRKVDLSLPPSRSRDIQRAFRERKKQRLQELEIQLDESEAAREAQQKEITQLQQVIRELQGENVKLRHARALPSPTPSKQESSASEREDIKANIQIHSSVSACCPPSILQAHQQRFHPYAKKDNAAVPCQCCPGDNHKSLAHISAMSPPLIQPTTIYSNIYPPASYPSPSLSYQRSSTGTLSDIVSPLNEPLVPSQPSSLASTTSGATGNCRPKVASTDPFDEQCCGGFFDCDEAIRTGLIQDVPAIRQCR